MSYLSEGEEMGRWEVVIRRHQELKVYRKAFEAAMQIFELSKRFPIQERYSLTDQVSRSSRSVCVQT